MQATEHTTAVLGVGVTGTSCVRHLLARGQTCVAFDDQLSEDRAGEFRQRFPGVQLVTAPPAPGDLDGFARLLVSPGIALEQPAVASAAAAGAEISGDIDLFCDEAEGDVVAITGSNGKSTVTALFGEMAAAAGIPVGVGGNIGTPALDLLQTAGTRLYVLELSSYQLERTSRLAGHVATVLNVTPDHMDRYAGLAEYQAAKQRIYRGCRAAVYNRADELTRPGSAVSAVSFGPDAPAAPDYGVLSHGGETWLARGSQRLFPVARMAITGAHNVQNALAALALGEAAGVPLQPMLDTLAVFKGLAHRCQHVADIDEVAWFDDSKGTNVGATLAAVAGLPGERIVLIAGGVGKGAEFSPLAAISARLRAVVLIGEAAAEIGQVFAAAVPCEFAGSMAEAVEAAAALARPGDAVLLSPACASFDMFANYAARGDAFVAAVRARAEVRA